MRVGLLLLLSAVLLAAAHVPDCPPHFEIGQHWADVVKACPDIDKQAFDRHGNIVSYYCPSQSVAVLGDVTTGQEVGFIKIDFNPHVK